MNQRVSPHCVPYCQCRPGSSPLRRSFLLCDARRTCLFGQVRTALLVNPCWAASKGRGTRERAGDHAARVTQGSSARSRASLPNEFMRLGCRRTFRIAPARAAASPGGYFRPASPTISRSPPMSDAMTSLPRIICSIDDQPDSSSPRRRHDHDVRFARACASCGSSETPVTGRDPCDRGLLRAFARKRALDHRLLRASNDCSSSRRMRAAFKRRRRPWSSPAGHIAT